MLSFLKNHRRNFLLALVELLIIFAGITTSLLVDEWRNEVGQKELCDEYLVALKSDINLDLEKLESVIKDKNLRLDSDSILHKAILFPDRIEISEQDFKFHFSRIAWTSEFISSDNTYVDLINTGNMKLIDNLDLKDRMYDYYNAVKNYNYLEKNDNTITREVLENRILEQFTIGSLFRMGDLYDGAEELETLDMAFLQDRKSPRFIVMENFIVTRYISLETELIRCSELKETLKQVLLELEITQEE